jgi:hypothetical protein
MPPCPPLLLDVPGLANKMQRGRKKEVSKNYICDFLGWARIGEPFRTIQERIKMSAANSVNGPF